MILFFRSVANHFREGGARGLLHKVGDKLLESIWSETKWVIYERALTREVKNCGELVARRELDSTELVRVGYYKAKAFPEEIERRFERGNICHGFFLGDRLATIGWSSPNYLELDRNVYFPCPGAVGLYDFLTLEEFRSRGFYANALIQLANSMGQVGFAKAFIAVDPGNYPSVRGIERAGFLQALWFNRRWRFGVSTVSYGSINAAR